METNLLPYFLLLITIIISWVAPPRFGLLALGLSSLLGLMLQRIAGLGLLWIFLSGLTLWIACYDQIAKWLRWIMGGIFLLIAIEMSNHLVPGFNNLLVFDKVRFSSDSAPFTMFLNFDKTVVGIFIYLFVLKNRRSWQSKDVFITLKTFVLLLVCMLPIALVTHYVRIDPKWPAQTWLWGLNNLFFVCLAEEALFRGFIQGGLTKLLATTKWPKWLPLVFAATLFGLAHYQGGLSYILMASLAGTFYGYAYRRTNRIESSIAVHFGLNLMHFLFFSYPWLSVGS